jgi:hypothetical protein
MEYLKYLAIGIGALAGWSFLLWISGYWSRNSFLGKVFSALILILSAFALIVAFFIRPDIGTISVSMEKGIISKINKVELIADLKLKKYSQKGDLMIIDDDKGRHYYARLLNVDRASSNTLDIYSVDSFIIDFMYFIGRIKNFYIILTWGKLGAFVMSALAVFIVWAAGQEGQLAFLIPGSD